MTSFKTENSKECSKQLLELVSKFVKVAEYKYCKQIITVFLPTSNKWQKLKFKINIYNLQ